MKKSNSASRKRKCILVVVLHIIVLFLLVFFLYDSPAKYVPNQDGEIYLNQAGEPIIYYTDLFGNTFYQDGIVRDYAAVPAVMEDTPVTADASVSPETNQN